MTGKLSVGIMTLATNRYAEHWKRLAETVDSNFHAGSHVTMHVMTDQVSSVLEFAQTLSRITVNVIEVQPLGWPQAPLQKFQSIVDASSLIDQDLLIHLDADMLVVDFQESDLNFNSWESGMALVRHPGYRRATPLLRTKNYVANPSVLFRDTYRMVKEGGIGTWEDSPKSQAFVPRQLRKTYVCGATWMGRHDQFLETSALLANNTRVDSNNGVIAKWHDESHLNWYAANRPCSILDSQFCFAEGLATLTDIKPKIIAVEKFDDRTR